MNSTFIPLKRDKQLFQNCTNYKNASSISKHNFQNVTLGVFSTYGHLKYLALSYSIEPMQAKLFQGFVIKAMN